VRNLQKGDVGLRKYIRRSRTTPSSTRAAITKCRSITSNGRRACPISTDTLWDRRIGIARAIPIRSGISKTLSNSDRFVTMFIHGSKDVVREVVDCLVVDVVLNF